MTSLLQKGAELRNSMRSSAFGQTVSYKRVKDGVTLTATIIARPNLVDYEIDGGDAGLFFQSMDFVFDVAQAVWSENSETFEPLAFNDSITYDGKTYEVAAVAGGQHFTYSDHKRLSWRIHTKEK
jgi:hypothetical protein